MAKRAFKARPVGIPASKRPITALNRRGVPATDKRPTS
jgi:hypothetical protein